jgi:predicted enzyme related to lactoylglutathione lyase
MAAARVYPSRRIAIMGKPVVHWEIAARDANRLEEFYTDMFEWRVGQDSPVHYRQVDTGAETGIQGTIAATGGSWPSHALFYVQVDDVQEYLRKAENLGGSTLVPPTELNGSGRFAVFRDPEGVPIGLVESAKG